VSKQLRQLVEIKMLATAAVAKSGITVEELRASAFHSWRFVFGRKTTCLARAREESGTSALLINHSHLGCNVARFHLCTHFLNFRILRF
jgi:hypothetical protein